MFIFVTIIMVVQIIPPLPICGPIFISKAMGWVIGAQTSLRQYASQSTLVPGLLDDAR